MKISFSKLLKIKFDRPLGLCWGGFDLLHSGHLFHFDFCKKRCKTLVVLINEEKNFPEKGINRPYMNERLRLKALSLIKVIDFVSVYRGNYPVNQIGFNHGKKQNTNYIPIEFIEKIKPDYYFKGYEYKNLKIPEEKFIKSNGGKMIYGPKNNIFSSTKIIKNIDQ